MKVGRKISVLHVTLYLEIGGLETLITEQSLNMDKSRFSLSVLCLSGYDEVYKKKLEEKGIPVYLIKRKNKFDLFFFKKISHFLTTHKIDVIHCHSGCFFNSALCAYFAGTTAMIYTAHGLPTETGLKAKIENKIAASLSTKMIAVSEEIEQLLHNSFPSQKEKISIVINGVNTDTFTPMKESSKVRQVKEKHCIPTDKTIIGSVGRLENVKNYPMLLRAFAQLSAHGGVHLLFVGEGSARKSLEDLAGELKIKNDVSFLGVQYDLHNLIPVIDIFALSSLSEGTSVSLLEAQSCGIPAVVTDVGGNGKIIKHGFNGFLCDLNDYSGMATQIASIIGDEELKKEMKINARKRVQANYNLTSMVNAYEKLYSEMMLISE